MRKVLEDSLAEDLVQAIDITWDGRTTPFHHNVELDQSYTSTSKVALITPTKVQRMAHCP